MSLTERLIGKESNQQKQKPAVLSDEFRDYDFLFKIIVVGDSGVGKSCLLLRYCDQMFIDSFISTIGVDFKFKTLRHMDKRVKLQIWDTAGQDRFRNITTNYFRAAHAVLFCADVTSQRSFENLALWKELVTQNCRNVNVMGYVIATKSDLISERQVSFEQGRQYAQQLGYSYIETSAKRDVNVDLAFTNLVPTLIYTALNTNKPADSDADHKKKELSGGKPILSKKSSFFSGCTIV